MTVETVMDCGYRWSSSRAVSRGRVTYMEAARVMAEKVLTNKKEDDERLKFAFKKTTGRDAASLELDILTNRLFELRTEYNDAKKEALSLTSVGDYQFNETLNLTDYAAYTAICSLLLNLDETINRQ